MVLSELTTTDITKLITLLSEEIAVLGVRVKMNPDKAPAFQVEIRSDERIIEKLEQMF